MRYPIVIHKDKGSAYGVTVPDILGCFSAGDTLEEAFANAREAIYAHLELLTEQREDIPQPSEVDAHIRNPDYAGGTWGYVDVDVADLLGPAERINVTIPKRALQKIDAVAAMSGESRSGLLTRAAIEYIGRSAVSGRMPAKRLKASSTRGGSEARKARKRA